MNYTKALLVGSAGCGKSAWLERFHTGQFRKDHVTGPDTWHMNLFDNHFEIQERRNLPDDLTDYDVIYVMWDLTSPDSYKVAELYKDKAKNKKIVLIGTKSDLTSAILTKDIHIHRQGQKCLIYIISAKSNYNFDKPFLAVAR